jgi:hypothetical protein
VNGDHGVCEREERLGEIILHAVEAMQSGQELDRGRFVAAHPEFHEELEAFFAGHDHVERLAAPLRAANSRFVRERGRPS